MQGAHGRVVWFPTFDADNHVKRAGTAASGIRVVDDRGAVLPETREVLKVCAAQRLVVHTGHASGEQALAPSRPRGTPAATASWSPTPSSTWWA